ncbi:secreted RxLR effector protein 161-like [Pyrus x bretschneideri]|uniref:secreted RxLR effector protein 161-like n=1 Tax=Pyrus x bretschneideri TaxID=225117 RepID=UPI00202DF99C|nr:secreted RxLR effector protein 161-like [Pyrus x bretschneideri]
MQSHSDHTIYVDDMIVTGDDHEEIISLQQYLVYEFEMKELGELKYFLRIEVTRSKHAEISMADYKPIDTPMKQNHKLALYPDQVPSNKERYQRLVGRLIYLSHTYPDIAYAVSVMSQFMHLPSEIHMDVVVCILRYLKLALGRGLLFSKNGNLNIEGYIDADWASSIADQCSTSGYFTFVGGNLVTWKSKKQKVVARSSAEAEFRGMTHELVNILTKTVSVSAFSNSLDKLGMQDIFAPT